MKLLSNERGHCLLRENRVFIPTP